MKVLGRRIRTIRLKKKLKQTDLAKGLNVTDTYISKVENGLTGLPKEKLLRLSKILGLDPDILTHDNIPPISFEILYRKSKDFRKDYKKFKERFIKKNPSLSKFWEK